MNKKVGQAMVKGFVKNNSYYTSAATIHYINNWLIFN